MKEPQLTAQTPRLLIAVDKFYPLLDGPGLQAQQTALQLRTRGMDSMIVTRQRQPDFARYEERDGIAIHRIRPHGSRSNLVSILTIPTLFAFMLRHRNAYDVMHIYDMRSYVLVAILVHWLTGKPFVLKVPAQGDVKRQVADSIPLSLFSRLLRSVLLPDRLWYWLLGQAGAIISISAAITQELEDCGLGHLVARVPGGVDTERFYPVSSEKKQAIREKLDLPQAAPIIVSHGRLTTTKRLDVLLEAFFALREDYPDLTVVLPGNNITSYRAYETLQEMILAAKAEDNVIFAGESQNVQEYLQAADIFALTSEREGMPNSLIEAMACGLPVITTDIGGANELVQHEVNGLIVPVGDVEAVEKGMRQLLENPSFAAALAEDAVQTIQQHYAWPVLLDKYIDLYTSLN